MPAKVAMNIDQSFLYTHLVCFSRHSVLDIVTARILYLIALARVLLMIERGCYALFFFFLFFFPESARGPTHLVTRPGLLPLPQTVQWLGVMPRLVSKNLKPRNTCNLSAGAREGSSHAKPRPAVNTCVSFPNPAATSEAPTHMMHVAEPTHPGQAVCTATLVVRGPQQTQQNPTNLRAVLQHTPGTLSVGFGALTPPSALSR